MTEMEPKYDSKATEERIYEKWLNSGYFNPDKCETDGRTKKEAGVFSIILPPPNVTGTLHIGHAAMLAVEDIMVRFARMKGSKTLWLPGTDHAAIATQSKVESIIYKKEGVNRHDLGREEFLKRVDAYAKESHDTIVNQIRRMGASVDWSREAFTLDEKRNFAVKTAFKKMYDAGLIYRDYKVVNWDPKGQTVISDDEIVYEERKAKFYTFKYSADFPFAVATTRPETKLGDTAVAVNPNDDRYKQYIGQEFSVDFVGTKLTIKIIADENVDVAFGTGALGVTPAHSQIDWDMAQKNNLPLKQVINEYAKMISDDPEISGKKTIEAREIIVDRLRTAGLLVKEEEVTQNISTAERTGGIVEPLPKLQWFIDVNKEFTLPESKINGVPSGSVTTLKKLMRASVEGGQIKINPERFEKVYYHWIDNLRDWCISRQIWYGHRIPAWYPPEADQPGAGNLYVGINPPEDKTWEQDSDTLDTWFSSGLWTFSTLGWPFDLAQGKPVSGSDLATYHPTTVLETGYDILFFWVARMVLMSGFLLGEVPFENVYLHGLVRDEKGRKMTKSLGNAIDPLELSDKYGADAVRLALIIGAAPGNDVKLSEDRVRGYRNFATKIWNAARFVMMNKVELNGIPELSEAQKQRLAEFAASKTEIVDHLEKFELHLAGEKAYHYFWHTFADKVIEENKDFFKTGTDSEKQSAYYLLEKLLLDSLKLLHPFVPFVTEAVYEKFSPEKLLLVENWD